MKVEIHDFTCGVAFSNGSFSNTTCYNSIDDVPDHYRKICALLDAAFVPDEDNTTSHSIIDGIGERWETQYTAHYCIDKLL